MKRNLRNMVELKELLKNPSPNLKVPVYTENEGEVNPVSKSKDKITLRQMLERLDAKVDAGFKHIDTRLDYIVSANNLKDLPKNKKI